MRIKQPAIVGIVAIIVLVATGLAIANSAISKGKGISIRLIVDGIEADPVPAQIIKGETMVPLSWVAEVIGADVQGEDGKDGGTVTISAGQDAQTLLQRLHALEPEQPETMVGDEMVDEYLGQEGNQLHSVADIRSLGVQMPFEILAEDDTWVRPYYAKEWHSTFMGGKFSGVSTLVQYAQHNLFVYHGGLSEGSGYTNRLGLADGPRGFFGGPRWAGSYVNGSFVLCLIGRQVKEIYRLNNEWMVVVEPRLQGLQSVLINYPGMWEGSGPDYVLSLFRVVTPEGYEMERVVRYLDYGHSTLGW